MIASEIEKLIIKYIAKSANTSDIDSLTSWLEDPTNLKEFKSYVKTHYAINYSLSDVKAYKFKKELLQKIRKDKAEIIKSRVLSVLKYAAIVILFVSVGYIYQDFVFEGKDRVIVLNEEFVTLELEDGNVKVISGDSNFKIQDDKGALVVSQTGDKLTYHNKSSGNNLVYNTIDVPYGRKFELQLSDGTHVYLNAGSTLKYPVNFIKDYTRQVFLVGEAFFDVAKREKDAFVVHADDLNVEVLGTQFNVSCYPEDQSIEVVLVEGSVNLSPTIKDEKSPKNVMLEPGFAGVYNRKSAIMSKDKVVTSIFISWIHGELVFRNTTFSNILTKMERHFNVEIENNNVTLSDEIFNASFGNEPLIQILEYFETTYNINFVVDNSKVIIN